MKQNYNLLTRSTALPNAANTFFTKSKLKLNGFLLVLAMLFGFSDAFGQIAQRGTATTASASNSATITIAKPTGVITGDIMILNIAYSDGGNLGGVNATLAGWTLINGSNLSSNRRRGCVLYKIATATEPANYTFSVPTGTDFIVGGILAYSGIDNANPFDVAPGTLNVNGGSTTVTATSITTVTANTQIIMLAMADLGAVTFNAPWNTTSPGALTELYDVSNTSPAIGAAHLAKASIGATGNGTVTISSSQGNAGILLALRPSPTISSLGTTAGCVGSSLIINGNNLSGATAVTIGGTAAVITANDATSVTVTVGTGTTGTVQVTTPGGTATSAATFTVHPLPAAIAGGAATVCTGSSTPAFTNASGGGTWSVIPVTGTASISPAGVLTGTTAGTVRVRYTLPTGCFNESGTITITTVPATVATPTPANGATGVCYAGTGAITSISWGAAAGATSYDVYFGAGSVPGTITANVATITYNTGTLAASTTYFWRVVAKNTCGDAVTSATFSFTTSGVPCGYCAPAHTVSCNTPITNVTFNTINNTSACANTNGTSYTNYGISGTPTTNLLIGSTYNLNVTTGASAIVSAWIDLNGNGVFQATEWTQVYLTGTNGNVNILIPGTATPGRTVLRIRSRLAGSANGSGDSCTSFGSGETEDYAITLVTPAPCVAPTAQPTALALTPSGTTISGSFTPAATADSYLVVISTSATPPTAPVNGVTYSIGGNLAPGYTIVDNDSNTSFIATGLSPVTTYYIYIYSMNALCTGGPTYLGTSPLTGNTTTLLEYCPSVPNTNFPDGITRVQFNTIDNATATTAAIPYTDYTATQNTTVTQGLPYNINVWANTDGAFTMVQMVWFDWNKDGDFNDADEAYNLGSVTNNANGLSSACPLSITIPVTSALGTTRMRVSSRFTVAGTPCENGQDGEVEDYSVTILTAPPCTEPTAQPTALILTPGATSISGSFTAAAPASQNYLVVMNTTGTAPTGLIMDGTTYSIGSSIGVGNTVIDTDTNTTFTASGLNTTTTYYFFVYAVNGACSGGPLYNTNPTVLIGNSTTVGVAPTPCTPVTNTAQNNDRYISRVAFIGTLVETNNTSTFSEVTPGYQDFTGLALKAEQAQGEGVNMIVESIGGRVRLHAWVDWNKNGIYESTEMVYGPPAAGISSTFGFVIPTGTMPGDYRVRVRTFNSFYDPIGPQGITEYFGYNFDACELFNTGTYTGETTTQYGEAEDYLFTVVQRCDANVTSVVDGDVCNSGVVDLIANGTAGTTEIRWYTALTGGTYLGSSLNGDTFETPSITTTTTYYCTAWNGTCESFVRTPVVARVNPTPTLTFTQSAPDVCGEDTIVALTAGGDKELTDLLYERFEGGGLGVFSNVNSDATIPATKADTKWTVRSSTFVPTAGMSWKPAISSGLAPNSFALATSDAGTPAYELVENSLTSGTLNSTNYLNLTMTMKFYYSRYFPDGDNATDEYVRIQISNNGGTTWTTLQEFTADTGIGTKFVNLSYDLNAYINQTNLRVRVLHHSLGSASGWLPDGVAVDDVRIFGEVPLNTAFVWSSPTTLPDVYTDPAATPGNEYVANTPVVTVYVKPTLAQLEMGSYVFTATATLSNGCTASQDITILNKSKIWKGTNGNNWADAANWEPVGVPDANSCVIIPSILDTNNNKSEIIGPGFNGFGKTLEVKDDGVLEVNSVNTLTITDYVKVAPAGTFLIEDSSSLVQINNVANTGNIRMQRNTNIRKLDYVYWSSPVAGFSSGAISPLTPASFIYKWAPTTVTGYASNFGNWVAGSESMATGAGYIVRGPDNFTTTKQIYQANFIGVPNNGIITTPISRSTYTGANYTGPTSTQVTADDDNWNLIGNPYPSAVNADTFLATNSTKISGFVKIWTHGTLPLSTTSDPFYQDFVLNYTVADYITHNALGGTQPTFDGFIPAGQGFFVRMIDAAATPNTVEFNNTMRSRTFRNDQFFRDGNVIPTNEKHRIWLQLVSPAGTESKSLVGYATSATNSIDHLYDAINVGVKTNFEIYSVAENQGLSIQGRSLPFDANDQIQLGVTIPQNGNYTIAIAAVDGLFTTGTQNIYLEDKLLNITHDLRSTPYSFTGTVGSNETRFVLKFNNETLGNEDFTTNAVTVYTNESINVNATNQTIKSVRVHDLLGRVIGTFDNVNANTFSTRNVAKTQSPLLVEVTLENGATKTYKVIF